MTPQVPAISPARTVRVGVVTWVDEQTLSERRAHFRVGEDLQALARPVQPDVWGGSFEDLPGAARSCWQLHPDADVEPAATLAIRSVRGRVAAIVAVVVPHRPRGFSVWEPIPGAARYRPVESTCTPETARSVWIPSGEPVLLGFLVTIEDAYFTHVASPIDASRQDEGQAGAGGGRPTAGLWMTQVVSSDSARRVAASG